MSGSSYRSRHAFEQETIDANRTALSNGGFKYYPVANGGQAIWMHADNSVARISGLGGTNARPHYHFKKQISDTFEACAQRNIVAKVTG